MPIVPSGTKRLMEAQTFGNDYFIPDEINNLRPLQTNQQPLTEENQPINNQLPQSIEQHPQQDIGELADLNVQNKEQSTNITEYIFNKLEGFGYPPRRLEEFESEFVKQKFYPGENKEVTIVVPDRYYGTRKNLSEEDVNALISEISEKFGLSFTEGEREDKKITLNFMSQQEAKKIENAENAEVVVGDELDEVYGSPSKEKDKTKTKKTKAYSALELIKMGREDWIDEIMKRSLNV